MAVADDGSIAAASRRLGLSPGAVALRLRVVEAELRAPLFRRVGRRVALTPQGAALLVHARRIVDDVRELRAAAGAALHAEQGLAGNLRLGVISTALTGLLPRVLASVNTHHPDLDLFVAPGTSSELHDRVLAGDLDAAVIVAPPHALPKTASFSVWRDEPFVVLAPADMSGADPLAALQSHPFIRYDRTNWGGRIADEYLRGLSIRPHQRYELDALEAIAVMVSQGLGISLAPDWAPPWPAGLQIAKLSLPAPAPRRRTGLFSLVGHLQRDVVAAFDVKARQILHDAALTWA